MDIITNHDGITISKPGGSLLNVSVSLARAEKDVSLISEIGDDKTGDHLIEFLQDNKINTDHITIYKNCPSSKAMALLDENSKPSYTFQKAYPAKRNLANPPDFTQNDILILGSMYSRDPEIEDDLKAYLTTAKRGGALIVYDPNVRHNHQLKNEASREMLLKNLAIADIIKGSDEDFSNIFEETEIEKMKAELLKINMDALIVITQGKNGSTAFFKNNKKSLIAKKIKVISTIGAGDAYTAGLVNSIIDQGLTNDFRNLTEDNLSKLMGEGSRFSSLVCQTMDNYIPLKK